MHWALSRCSGSSNDCPQCGARRGTRDHLQHAGHRTEGVFGLRSQRFRQRGVAEGATVPLHEDAVTIVHSGAPPITKPSPRIRLDRQVAPPSQDVAGRAESPPSPRPARSAAGALHSGAGENIQAQAAAHQVYPETVARLDDPRPRRAHGRWHRVAGTAPDTLPTLIVDLDPTSA